MTTFAIEPGPVADAYERACQQLDTTRVADLLWRESLDIWLEDADARKVIANRLGWLRALDAVEPELERLRTFADGVRREGYERVLLMGMGGSSLAPEVLRRVLGEAPGFPRLLVTDTVNPDAVRARFAEPVRTLFVIASKSGTTIEPSALAAYAKGLAEPTGSWGTDVVAITDPDTELYRQAKGEGFRNCFLNPPNIGGRYSALSLFGMVPAALIGADLDALVVSGRRMTAECQQPGAARNPGLALGAFMAAAAEAGRDKLTLLLPASFESFGLWVEQLVAESTGKTGKGVVPIVGESADAPYGADRCFVVVSFCGEGPASALVQRARATGAPMATIEVPTPADLAAEFMRWEVATAVAGLRMEVNPFDEPDVKLAKEATREVLEAYERDGVLPVPAATAVLAGARLTLGGPLSGATDPWAAAVRSMCPGDYVAVLGYAPPEDAPFGAALERLRARLGASGGVAATGGYGPRYLHSTGQLHKGGANTGVFVIVSAEPDADVVIPGEPRRTFGILEAAQALGDYLTLSRLKLNGGPRRVVSIHLPRRDPALLDQITAALTR